MSRPPPTTRHSRGPGRPLGRPASRSSGSAAVPTKRVAIYTRKSTTKGLDQDFNSLDAQRTICEQHAQTRAREGWRILDTRYDDGGFSGATLDRPAFQRLVDDIENGLVDVVVAYKLDRISRSTSDFVQLVEWLNDRRTELVIVTEQFDTTTPFGRAMTTVLMALAQMERERTAERTRDKIAAARERGMWTGGALPIGYTNVNKRLVIEPSEAVAVHRAFALYHQSPSPIGVARALDAEGHRTRGRPGADRVPGRWTKPAVLNLLQNPIYAGLIRSGDTLVDGEHEAIVPRERWEAVQALIDRRRGGEGGGRNTAYLLSGLVRCGCCGAAYVAGSTRKKGQEYRYYRCSNRDRLGADACPAAPVRAPGLEEAVVAQMREVAADPGLVEDVCRELGARVERERRDLQTERQQLPRDISRLAEEAERLGGAPGQGRLSLLRPEDQERRAELEEQAAQKRSRLSVVHRRLEALDAAEVDARQVAGMLRGFERAWPLLTLENQHRLLRAVIERIDIQGDNGQVAVVLADLAASADTAVGEGA
jgi:site-specific DNA recombinase